MNAKRILFILVLCAAVTAAAVGTSYAGFGVVVTNGYPYGGYYPPPYPYYCNPYYPGTCPPAYYPVEPFVGFGFNFGFGGGRDHFHGGDWGRGGRGFAGGGFGRGGRRR